MNRRKTTNSGRDHRGSVGLLFSQSCRVGLAFEYSSYFISVMNPNLNVHCFDALMSRSHSRGPNNLHVYEPQENLGRGLLQPEPVIYY